MEFKAMQEDPYRVDEDEEENEEDSVDNKLFEKYAKL